MSEKSRRILRWAPRILGILYALFLSIFALDVFGVGYSAWETVVALAMHLIPVYILLIGVALGWRWQWIGAATFLGFCLWYVISTGAGNGLSIYITIIAPPFVTGMLFLLNWLYRPRLHANTAHS